jgi:hypothetical protein
MIQRFASILVIAIALLSFVSSSSFAQDENRPGRKPERKEHVVKRKVYRSKRHKVIVRGHKRKTEKTDVRVKVNL